MKKLAMIGCGGIGTCHLGHFLDYKDIELAGFCDLIPERADAAKAQYTGEYDEVYATYDVTAGAWTVSFSKSAAGAKTDRLVVDAAGKVMAAGK